MQHWRSLNVNLKSALASRLVRWCEDSMHHQWTSEKPFLILFFSAYNHSRNLGEDYHSFWQYVPDLRVYTPDWMESFFTMPRLLTLLLYVFSWSTTCLGSPTIMFTPVEGSYSRSLMLRRFYNPTEVALVHECPLVRALVDGRQLSVP